MLLPTLLFVLVANVSAGTLKSRDVGFFSTPAIYQRPSYKDVPGIVSRDRARRGTPPPPDTVALDSGGRYTTVFTIGNKPYSLLIDSGSADTWVYSSTLPEAVQNDHNPYTADPNNVLPSCTFSVSYYDKSSAQGGCVQDSMKVGDGTLAALDKYHNDTQVFGLATTVNNDGGVFPDACTGLAGLANIVPQGITLTISRGVTQNIFQSFQVGTLGVWFPSNGADNGNPAKELPGMFDWGNQNPSHYCSGCVPTVATPLADAESQGLWKFPATKCQWILPGKTDVTESTYPPGNSNAVIDTGTALIYLDPVTVTAYYQANPDVSAKVENKLWTFACSARDSLPTLKVELDGKLLMIPTTVMSFGSSDGIRCVGGLQASSAGQVPTYGVILFNAHYISFNIKDKTVSHAPIVPWPGNGQFVG